MAPVGTVANILVVPAVSPYRSVREMVAAARASPRGLTYGSAGLGTSLHLCAALFCARAGIEMTHVPYRGSGPAVTDLVAGRIDAMFDSATSAAPHLAQAFGDERDAHVQRGQGGGGLHVVRLLHDARGETRLLAVMHDLVRDAGRGLAAIEDEALRREIGQRSRYLFSRSSLSDQMMPSDRMML
nr:tripartite tricarboxylate transporter substrate-binding protein [Rhodovarius lipocyclicus]